MTAEGPYEDTTLAYSRFWSGISIDSAAINYLTPPYQSMFFPELRKEWTPPTDAELRELLLENWSEDEVDSYMQRRDEARRARERRLAWEATFRGKATMAWRGFRRESSWRVSTAWMVLRHGKAEDDE